VYRNGVLETFADMLRKQDLIEPDFCPNEVNLAFFNSFFSTRNCWRRGSFCCMRSAAASAAGNLKSIIRAIRCF
jgi:hypothetical protein